MMARRENYENRECITTRRGGEEGDKNTRICGIEGGAAAAAAASTGRCGKKESSTADRTRPRSTVDGKGILIWRR